MQMNGNSRKVTGLPGRREQDEEKEVGLNVRIPLRLRRHIKSHCALIGVTIESFVAQALEEKLAREEKQVMITPQETDASYPKSQSDVS
jgi:hypothetical protein